MPRFHRQIRAGILALALGVPAAWAQQSSDPRVNPPVQPLGADSSKRQPTVGAGNSPDISAQIETDAPALSGADKFSPGSSGRSRSFLSGGFQFMENADTNPTNAGSSPKIDASSLLSGQLSLQRIWRHSQFTLDYMGGAVIFNTASGLNSNFHEVGLSEQVDWRRWNLHLSDSFTYLPDAGAGFAGNGLPLFYGLNSGLGTVGNPLLNLNPGVTPSQSIFTGRARRFSETGVSEFDYVASARTTFTFSASFGVLRFLDPGYFNSKNYSVQAGWDRNVTAKDTFSIKYGASLFRFDVGGTGFLGQNVQVAYGRRLTGRMAFKLSGGPQFNRIPTTTGVNKTQFSWGMQSNLNYTLPNWSLDFSFTRYVSAGAGVLFGAYANEVRGSASRHVSRQWNLSLNGAYAYNQAIQQTTSTATPLTFRTLSGGAAISRPFGHTTNFSVSYTVQRQTNGTCVLGACAPTYVRHIFGVGLGFNLRPIHLD